MRFFISFCFILLSLTSTAQVVAGPDQFICEGDSTQLSAWNGSNYSWTSQPPDPTLTNPFIPNPWVKPADTTMYMVESREVSGNLIVNGDFESGNTGFYSDYIYNPGSVVTEGTYAITNDANSVHYNFFCSSDHTTGSGNMMVVNGASIQNEVVWGQSIPAVQPNTSYEFSVWISSMVSNNPAILQFRINGILIGLPFQVNPGVCEWNQFFKIWNSGASTSADISIVNMNTNLDGNDFALDDISFSEVTYYTDTTWVYVTPVPTSSFSCPLQTCLNEYTLVTYTGNAPATADYFWDFDGATVISGSGPGPYELQWTTSGMKQISLYVEGAGCTSDTTNQQIQIMDIPEINVSADALSIPYGTFTTLHAAITATPGPYTHIWSPASLVKFPDLLDTETENLDQTTTFYMHAADGSSACRDSADITIVVTGGPLGILSLSSSENPICLNDSTELQISIGGGSGTYISSWRSDPPGFSHTGNELSVVVWPDTTTWYYVSANDGFNSTPEDSVQVIVLPQIELTTQPADVMAEEGETITFLTGGNFATSYQWQLSEDAGTNWNNLSDNSRYSGTQTFTLTVFDVPGSMDGYLYRCLLEGDCDPVLSNEAVLNIYVSAEIITGMEDIAVCEGDTFQLPCEFSGFVDIDSLHLVFSFDTSLLEFTGVFHIIPELTDLQNYQDQDSIIINWTSASAITASDGIFFNLEFIAQQDGQGVVELEYNSIARNVYGSYLDVILSHSNIDIAALPEEPDHLVADPDSMNILDEAYIDLEAFGGSGDEIVWAEGSCNGPVIGTGSQISIYRPQQSTNYFAYWENDCGRSICKEVEVIITEEYQLSFPNAFSPNGDGLNDEFGIVATHAFPNFEMHIYNRWGQLVFSSQDQDIKWDGTFDGEKAPAGVYSWIAKIQAKLEGAGSDYQTEAGTVVLVR